MKNKFEEFNSLHKKLQPLLIGNAWSVQSAKVFEQQGYKAIATSSASVADTFGYEDGEEMTFNEYFFVIERMAKSVKVPLSVDLESGYGDSPEAITKNIRALYDIGISGINLEDSHVTRGKRTIDDANAFADKIRSIVKLLKKDSIDIFINLRCDAFLLGLSNALDEGIRRSSLYQQTGAHGLFIPCITSIDDIKQVCSKSALPVNVMCMPNLPDFDALQKAGVKRISMGPFVSRQLYKKLESTAKEIVEGGSFGSLFG